jgi:hypothetical protein
VGWLIWFFCTWESLALTLQKFGIRWVPTISAVMWWLRDHAGPAMPMIAGAVTSWMCYHFWLEGR